MPGKSFLSLLDAKISMFLINRKDWVFLLFQKSVKGTNMNWNHSNWLFCIKNNINFKNITGFLKSNRKKLHNWPRCAVSVDLEYRKCWPLLLKLDFCMHIMPRPFLLLLGPRSIKKFCKTAKHCFLSGFVHAQWRFFKKGRVLSCSVYKIQMDIIGISTIASSLTCYGKCPY